MAHKWTIKAIEGRLYRMTKPETWIRTPPEQERGYWRGYRSALLDVLGHTEHEYYTKVIYPFPWEKK